MRDVPGYCCSKRHRNTMTSATAWCMNHRWSWYGSSAQNVGPFYGEQHLGVRLQVDSSCLCLRCMSLTSLVHHQDVHPAACADSARCRSTCSTRRLRPRNPHLHMHQHPRHAAATLTNHPRAPECRLTWMQEWCTMQKSRRFNLTMKMLHWLKLEEVDTFQKLEYANFKSEKTKIERRNMRLCWSTRAWSIHRLVGEISSLSTRIAYLVSLLDSSFPAN